MTSTQGDTLIAAVNTLQASVSSLAAQLSSLAAVDAAWLLGIVMLLCALLVMAAARVPR
jgi:uncharacterized membrane protein AbrB (regulator of aidB expression)